MIRGFTIVEGLVTVGISSILLVLLFGYFGTSVNQFVQGDDTLTSGRHAQLLLSYLKADISMADAPGGSSLSASPDTGTTYPKNFVHLLQTTESASRLMLFTHSVQSPPVPIPTSHPIAPWLQNPVGLTRLSVSRAARIQNAFAWVEPPAATPSDPRFFVVNVRTGVTVSRVVYTFLPSRHVVRREGPEGTTSIGESFVTSFACSPYIEFLGHTKGQRPPLELLKCWVEVHLAFQAPAKHDRIGKKPVEVNTRVVPRFLTASVRGLTGL